MKTLLSLTCLLLVCNAVRADDGKPAPAAAQAGPIVETKPASAKAAVTPAKTYAAAARKSVFPGATGDHNPFWPIGWVNMESFSGDSAAPLVPRVDDFQVTSILLNEPPMAVINGKEMAEGEIASVTVNGQAVMVQLMAVQDGRVILRWQNQNLTVPLHRQEELSRADVDPSVAALR